MTTQTANILTAIGVSLFQVIALLAIGLAFRVDRNWENNAPNGRSKDGA